MLFSAVALAALGESVPRADTTQTDSTPSAAGSAAAFNMAPQHQRLHQLLPRQEGGCTDQCQGACMLLFFLTTVPLRHILILYMCDS